MTFTYKGADLSKTIKTFCKVGDSFYIMYLDGSYAVYYSSNDNELDKIENKLLEQVQIREEKYKPDFINDTPMTLLKKRRELKKYKIFLEMYKYLPTVNEAELLMSVEEKLYQIPLAINTLDDYSLFEMKVLQRRLTKMINED